MDLQLVMAITKWLYMALQFIHVLIGKKLKI